MPCKENKLSTLIKSIQAWLMADRDQAREKVTKATLNAFAAVDSPELREGVSNGLDFLRLLKDEGADNSLWQVTMDQLESEILSAIATLSNEEQVALLLPLVDDLDGLGERLGEEIEYTWVLTEQWATLLRKHLSNEWLPIMRDLVMKRV